MIREDDSSPQDSSASQLACFDDRQTLGTVLHRVVVSVSTSRSRDGLETYQRLVSVSSREKLSTSRSREADVSVSSRSRPFTSRAQDQCINIFLIGMQMAPYTQCERALELCCSYYCSSY